VSSTDQADGGPDDGPDDGPEETGEAGAEGGAAPEGRRRRRRRRRRNGPEGGEAPAAQAEGAPAQAGADNRPRRDWNERRGANVNVDANVAEAKSTTVDDGWDAPDDVAAPAPAGVAAEARDESGRNERGRRRRDRRGRDAGSNAPASSESSGGTESTGAAQQARDGRRDGNRNEPRGRNEQRNRDAGGEQQRTRDGGRNDQRARDGGNRNEQRARDGNRNERRDRTEAKAQSGEVTGTAAGPAPTEFAPPAPRLEARRPAANDDDHDAVPESAGAAWGTEEDGPPKDVTLAADLPTEAASADLDPSTAPLLDGGTASLSGDIANMVGVRSVTGGRIQWFDAGDTDLKIGERVLVDTERGPRLGTVATAATRRQLRERNARRVLRRANEADLRGERDGEAERAKALRIAKDVAAALRLPLKVFRVELNGPLGRGSKLNVYYNTDERLDLRDFVRDLGNKTGGRIELRQLGTRDEAKAVGGIGSCGLTLCCTTWLPDFVPVSIKMAKDQGLVLSPTKIAGQCGRLKCCLVYEQAGYAELRKGLPKLGKRVVAPRGEGRVVEVDVLRQRVRVSYGMGDTEVLPASEVKPLFPSGGAPQAGGGAEGERPPRADRRKDRPGRDTRGAAAADLPPTAEQLYPDLDDDEDDDAGPTDDPSSMHHVGTDDPSSDDFQP
jgi:cell fate regulator YaaT (PSP1 superfamily)